MLFGAGAPVAKLLLADASPFMLAGLLYCGSGLGLSLVRVLRRAPEVHLRPRERYALAGSVGVGGIAGPVLLLIGLTAMPASGASLLLNAEAVLTAVLAWVVFREHVNRRVLLGLVAIVAGAAVLSVPDRVSVGTVWPSLAILAACFCWGLDNNLTSTIASNDASWLAAVKGLVAGPVNLGLALLLGGRLPDLAHIGAALITGFFAYGVSLTLFIVALRHVGAARAGAYYSVAPFFGALLAILLGGPITTPLLIATALMALGVWLHLTERAVVGRRSKAVRHTH